MIHILNFQGKKLPVRISYYALTRFMQETGGTMESIAGDPKKNIGPDLIKLEVLLWYSLEAGAEIEGKELQVTRDKTPFILDQNTAEFSKILLDYINTNNTATVSEETKKKSLIEDTPE